MRCRPSMRMSLTVKGWNAYAATGAERAANRISAATRFIVGSGTLGIAMQTAHRTGAAPYGKAACLRLHAGSAFAGRPIHSRGKYPQDVVVEGEAHQHHQQRHAHVLAGGHCAFRQRIALDELDEVVQLVPA